MKKSLLTVLILAVIALSAQSILVARPNLLNSKSRISSLSEEDRKLSGFTKIEISGSYEVRIIKSNTYSVKVEADEDQMSKIITEVSGDKLVIRYIKEGKNYDHHSSKKLITIQTPNLNSLTCSGAVEVKSSDIFDAEKFDLKTSGATEVEIGINAKLLISKFSGATEVELKGKVDTHALEMTGASELDAVDLQVSKYAIESKGAADCKIYVTDELAISGSGASSIKYKGSPSKVTKDTRGATDVSRL
jgi:Putative auto-transporter adhesin, head GIN domain